MKKITLIAALAFAAFSTNAQTEIFFDDFESYDNFIIENVGDWTLTDVDGLPTYGFNGVTFENSGYTGAYIVFNSTATTPPLEPDPDSDWSAFSGEKAMTSFAAVPSGSQGNDDWLISPAITLGASGNQLEFWAKAATTAYPNETFNVLVSTTDTDLGSFTSIGDDLLPPAASWIDFVFDLDAYANETVYIAINHVGFDQFGFLVDDFKVTADVLGVNDAAFNNFNYFVNEGTLSMSAAVAMDSVELYNVLGQAVVSQTLSNTTEAVNISSLSAGVYIAKVSIDGATKSFKIVKK